MTAERIAHWVNIDASNVVGHVVRLQFFDRAARRMNDPNRMIRVLLVNDLIRANERGNWPLSPLRLIGALPYTQTGIAFEESHDTAELFLPLRMCGVNLRELLEKRRA